MGNLLTREDVLSQGKSRPEGSDMQLGTHSSGNLFTKTTRMGRNEGKQAVFYHSTPVVTWDTNTIVLSTGEWKTVTTKIKINQTARDFHLGFVLYQERGNWFVVLRTGEGVDGLPVYDWENPAEWVDCETHDFTIVRSWRGEIKPFLFFSCENK